MSKKKFTTALASAVLAGTFVVAPLAPANALVMVPQGPRATICYYFPFWC